MPLCMYTYSHLCLLNDLPKERKKEKGRKEGKIQANKQKYKNLFDLFE